MKRPSLRTALLAPVLVVLLIGIAALGVFLHQRVERNLIASVDEELVRVGARDGRVGAPAPDRNPILDDLSEGDLALLPVEIEIAPDGSVRPLTRATNPLSAEQLEALPVGAGPTTIDGDPAFRALAEPGRGGSIAVVAISLASTEETLASLRRNLILGGLALFVIQGLVIWVIASRVASPVRRMSDVATSIADGELDTEIGEPGGTSETAALARDLEHMVGRLRRTIDERAMAADEANAARADMQRFLADASHELRTPLTAVKGYSDLYQRGMLAEPADLDRAMGRVGSEADRLHRLVVDMLDVVRERQPGRSGSADVVELAAICAAVIDDASAAFPQHTIELDADRIVLAFGDANRLHQALLNLVSNACHHTPVDSSIEVVVRGVRELVEVAVVDRGPGVPSELADAVFRPFVRGDASRTRRDHDGAGLGLSIVRRIVDEHRGTVFVEPTPGGGATFRLQLPATGNNPTVDRAD